MKSSFRLALPVEVGRHSAQIADHVFDSRHLSPCCQCACAGHQFCRAQGFPRQRRVERWLPRLPRFVVGGTVTNFSLLSMGVYPYITAQIILQLLIPIIPALQRRMQEDPREGQKWMERWTYFLAVPMAALSAIGQINIFNSLSVQAQQE